MKTACERFWAKVDKTGDCWLWTAYTCKKGYGIFSVKSKPVKAHRYSYELFNGEIAEGLVIDHLCRNRACVNPAHLEAVTDYENKMRGISAQAQNKRKTHCTNGHEFTEENTYYRADGKGRQCKTCNNKAVLEFYHKNKGGSKK